MDIMDFGIIVLAALMVWLLYKATQETRAYGAHQKQYVLRQARTLNRVEERFGGQPARR
jgi:hypothetical protein